MSNHRTSLSELQKNLPEEWPHDLVASNHECVSTSGVKVVVLDDDPTGTQTVYDVGVLTDWTVKALKAELQNEQSGFYILTNSRSVSSESARQMNREIARNLAAAANEVGTGFAVVSRSDSTLRGHFPVEIDALQAALDTSFDGVLVIPFFLEGGRYTCCDVHYVAEGEQLVPAAETPFARDLVFGYQSSNLRSWVEEKTGGRIDQADVASIALNDLREGGPEKVAEQLLNVEGGRYCIVNALSYRDMDVFVAGLLKAEAQGKRFLYRTAASFVRSRLGMPGAPLLTANDLLTDPGEGAGLTIVGSHVPLSTRQLQALLDDPLVEGVELDVARLIHTESVQGEVDRVSIAMNAALKDGRDTAVYTSRKLISDVNADANLEIGQLVSESVVEIVRRIDQPLRYIVAKGGITSSDVAVKGLDVKRALVLGQILPGVPVWRLGCESRFPDVPYVVFPGNVGTESSIADVVQMLR